MRTTVRLDDDLLAQAKRLAVETGRTLTALIEDVLREAIARQKQPVKKTRATLPTFRGEGIRPGVDLDNTAQLLDLMDGADGAG